MGSRRTTYAPVFDSGFELTGNQATVSRWVPSAPAPRELTVTSLARGEVDIHFIRGREQFGGLIFLCCFMTPFVAIGIGFTIVAVLVAVAPESLGEFTDENGQPTGPPSLLFSVVFALGWDSITSVFVVLIVLGLRRACFPERHCISLRNNELEYTVMPAGCRRSELDAKSTCFVRILVVEISLSAMPNWQANGEEQDRSRICIKASDGAMCYVDLPPGPAQHWLMMLLQKWLKDVDSSEA